MAVKTESLDNQERGMDLSTREAGPPEPHAMLERIREVRATPPMSKDDAPHCAACFERGWNAALRALE